MNDIQIIKKFDRTAYLGWDPSINTQLPFLVLLHLAEVHTGYSHHHYSKNYLTIISVVSVARFCEVLNVFSQNVSFISVASALWSRRRRQLVGKYLSNATDHPSAHPEQKNSSLNYWEALPFGYFIGLCKVDSSIFLYLNTFALLFNC